MTPAEAHVWIAVFASAVTQPSSIGNVTFEKSIALANRAVERLNEEAPSALRTLNEALRQGSDIP